MLSLVPLSFCCTHNLELSFSSPSPETPTHPSEAQLKGLYSFKPPLTMFYPHISTPPTRNEARQSLHNPYSLGLAQPHVHVDVSHWIGQSLRGGLCLPWLRVPSTQCKAWHRVAGKDQKAREEIYSKPGAESEIDLFNLPVLGGGVSGSPCPLCPPSQHHRLWPGRPRQHHPWSCPFPAACMSWSFPSEIL